jgi:hypothetical protein
MIANLLCIAKNVRRSAGFKFLIATRKRMSVKARQRLNDGVFSVEIEARCGFFSVMQMILFILLYCEENSLWPDVSAKGGVYGDEYATVDWVALLFERVRTPQLDLARRLDNRRNILTSKVKDVSELGFRPQYETRLSLAVASRLFNDHFRPATDVLAEVDSISNALGISNATLAVHYRGTDKVHEAGHVPWSIMLDSVDKIAALRSDLRAVLLASDDAGFIEFFKTHSFKLPVILAPARYMPKGSTPIHFSGHPGLAIGREALVTCLLLARCGFLIKNASYLSGWAKIFNPSLQVWLVSPQIGRGFFPDRVLWSDQVLGKVSFGTNP